MRYVSHYSGWGPGQLDEELRVGGWLAGTPNPEIIFGDPDQVWEEAVNSAAMKSFMKWHRRPFGDPNSISLNPTD